MKHHLEILNIKLTELSLTLTALIPFSSDLVIILRTHEHGFGLYLITQSLGSWLVVFDKTQVRPPRVYSSSTRLCCNQKSRTGFVCNSSYVHNKIYFVMLLFLSKTEGEYIYSK